MAKKILVLAALGAVAAGGAAVAASRASAQANTETVVWSVDYFGSSGATTQEGGAFASFQAAFEYVSANPTLFTGNFVYLIFDDAPYDYGGGIGEVPWTLLGTNGPTGWALGEIYTTLYAKTAF